MKLFSVFFAGAATIVLVGVIAALLMGCAVGPLDTPCYESGSQAYTHERPTRPFQVTIAVRGVDSWNADGAPTVLTAHNPTDQLRQLFIQCWPSVPPTYIDYGLHNWWTCVKPHREKRRLVEFMNVDALSQVCSVAQQWVTTPDLCVEDAE